VFTLPTARKILLFRTILSSPFAPLQSSIAPTPPASWFPPKMTASLAVSSPSTSCRYRAATCLEGYQPSSTFPRSVSHALRAFFRPVPAGLVSCRSRPWGSTLQGRSSLAEQFVLSDAFALLGLAGFLAAASAASSTSGSEEPGVSGATWSALLKTCPSSGLCSLRVTVSPGRLLKPTRRSRPSWVSPP